MRRRIHGVSQRLDLILNPVRENQATAQLHFGTRSLVTCSGRSKTAVANREGIEEQHRCFASGICAIA
jgi:hypothetical protein